VNIHALLAYVVAPSCLSTSLPATEYPFEQGGSKGQRNGAIDHRVP